MKEEKSVIIEAAVADLMQFAELLIWENPEIQKKMQEMDLKPEDVKAGIQGKKMEKEVCRTLVMDMFLLGSMLR